MHNLPPLRESRFSSVLNGFSFSWRSKTKQQLCEPRSDAINQLEGKSWDPSPEKVESTRHAESGCAAKCSCSLEDEVTSVQANEATSECSIDSYDSGVSNSKLDPHFPETSELESIDEQMNKLNMYQSEQIEGEHEYGSKKVYDVGLSVRDSLAEKSVAENIRWNEHVGVTEKNRAYKFLGFSASSMSSSSSSSFESENSRTGSQILNDEFIQDLYESLPLEGVDGQKVIDNVPLACAHEEFSNVLNELIAKMGHNSTEKQGEAVAHLRSLTRNPPENRAILCQSDLLAALVPLLESPSSSIRIHSIVALFNLSLDKNNKIKITRAGAVPPIINILKKGHPEVQEHAAAVIFSLALNDENKFALGVLGAIPPLMNILKSSSSTSRGRKDATMALYVLSAAQLNRTKMVNAGLVPVLLGIAKEHNDEFSSYAMRILSCLASTEAGRSTLLELNSISVLLTMIEHMEPRDSNEADKFLEHTMTTLLLLSQKYMRFKPLALQAGALDILTPHKERGTQRSQGKCLALLKILTEPIAHQREPSSSPSFDPSQYPRSYLPREARAERAYIPGNKESRANLKKEKAQTSFF